MYDEHGGYYDHVPPPRRDRARRHPAADRRAARPARRRATATASACPAYRDLAVREDATTCRTWCTTTRRCCKFIETKFNLGALTYRDANADNLLDCFDFQHARVPRAADARRRRGCRRPAAPASRDPAAADEPIAERAPTALTVAEYRALLHRAGAPARRCASGGALPSTPERSPYSGQLVAPAMS